MLVGPRSPPRDAKGRPAGIGISGYLVVTPFTDETSHMSFLVNRGWVPRRNIDLAFNEDTTTAASDGRVEFEGIVTPAEKGNSFIPEKDKATGSYFSFDLDSMNLEAGLSPNDSFLVERVNGRGPLKCTPVEEFLRCKIEPHTHLGYAATWYGFCAAGLVILKKRFL